MRQKEGRRRSFLEHGSFNHWHDSKEQGPDRGTGELGCANDVNSSTEAAWRSGGGDGEASQGVEAGLASASSPVRLMLVREKAKSLHEDLKKKHGEE